MIMSYIREKIILILRARGSGSGMHEIKNNELLVWNMNLSYKKQIEKTFNGKKIQTNA